MRDGSPSFPGAHASARRTEEMIRVDHAGEFAAVQIYRGQRAVFEHAHDAMTILSPTGYILEANRRWAVLLGAPPEAMVGRHIRDFATDLSSAEYAERFRLMLSEGGGQVPRVALRKSDGSSVFVDFSVSSTDIGGDPLVVAIGRDDSGKTFDTLRSVDAAQLQTIVAAFEESERTTSR